MRLGLVAGGIAATALPTYRAAEEERRTRETERRRQETYDRLRETPKVGQVIGGEQVTDLQTAAAHAGFGDQAATMSPEDIATNLENARTLSHPEVQTQTAIPLDAAGQADTTPVTAAATVPDGQGLTHLRAGPGRARALTSVPGAGTGSVALQAASPAASALPAPAPTPTPAPVVTPQAQAEPYTFTLTNPFPNARVSSPYGPRIRPIPGASSQHGGQDEAVPMNSTVGAMGPGRVISAGRRGGLGNAVVVDHGGGWTTTIGHMSSVAVAPGDTVTAGQPLGLSGSTGISTGPHAHIEVRHNGRTVDPHSVIGRPLTATTGPAGSAEHSNNPGTNLSLSSGFAQQIAAMGSMDTSMGTPVSGDEARPITAVDRRPGDAENPDTRYAVYRDVNGRQRVAINPRRATQDDVELHTAMTYMRSEDPEFARLGLEMLNAHTQRRQAELQSRSLEINNQTAELSRQIARAAATGDLRALARAYHTIDDHTNAEFVPRWRNPAGEMVYDLVLRDDHTGEVIGTPQQMTTAGLFAAAAQMTDPAHLGAHYDQVEQNKIAHVGQIIGGAQAEATNNLAIATLNQSGQQHADALDFQRSQAGVQQRQWEAQYGLASAPNYTPPVTRLNQNTGQYEIVEPAGYTDPRTGRHTYLAVGLPDTYRFNNASDALAFANPQVLQHVEPVLLQDGSVGFRARAFGSSGRIYADSGEAMREARSVAPGRATGQVRATPAPAAAPRRGLPAPAAQTPRPAAAPAPRSGAAPAPAVSPVHRRAQVDRAIVAADRNARGTQLELETAIQNGAAPATLAALRHRHEAAVAAARAAHASRGDETWDVSLGHGARVAAGALSYRPSSAPLAGD